MLCDNCKNEIVKNANFCEKCGASVSSSEYPRVELASSGPMKYLRTNLDIARLDLNKYRISLDDKYSGYIIPAENGYIPVDIDSVVTKKKSKSGINSNLANNIQKNHSSMPYVNTNQSPDVAMNMQDMSEFSRQYPGASYPSPRNHRYIPPRSNNRNLNSKNEQKTPSGLLEMFMAIFSIMFINIPPMAIVIAVSALVRSKDIDKNAQIKKTINGIAAFVLIMSFIKIFMFMTTNGFVEFT